MNRTMATKSYSVLHWLFALLLAVGIALSQVGAGALQTANVHLSAVTVMPLGDSITFGIGSSDGGGYRLPLWNDLLAQHIHVHFVGSLQQGPDTFDTENEGHSGWRIDQIARHVVTWLHEYRPQIVLLHIGTNDIAHNYALARAPDRLSSLIDEIASADPGVRIFVALIIPCFRNAFTLAQTAIYNQAIPALVRSKFERGVYVQSVDMQGIPATSMLRSGLHPNDAGYKQMATIWMNALLPLLSSLLH